jgi:UDP-N-acetylglucosamine 2-epimerase (non-hydrolysing)
MATRIFCVVGARPNMMKMAPLLRELKKYPSEFEPLLVHTGQHYDYKMSKVFFEQLNMPDPDYNLEVGSGTHHHQTAEVMKRFGEITQKDHPQLILVVGDVNSTMACALVGAKEMIPVAHVEAGLRSFDRGMPEEINRIVTDAISDFLFITEEEARGHLHHEGVADEKVFFTGNVMIDSLVYALDSARASGLGNSLGVKPQGYAILTMHRPSNVDDPVQLRKTMDALQQIAKSIPILFPVHPRTAAKIREMGITLNEASETNKVGNNGLWSIPPASYIDFIGLVNNCKMVITDSGGIQEETTYLGVPCLTYRENTERPATVKQGTNRLIGANPARLLEEASALLKAGHSGKTGERVVPPLWDGHAAERIVKILRDKFSKS